jgi:hypothetical protein
MSRNDFDFYPTPPAAIHALGAWLKKTMPGYLAGVWLDPCVGAGAIPLWLSPYLEKGTPPSEKGTPPSVVEKGAPPSEKGTPPSVVEKGTPPSEKGTPPSVVEKGTPPSEKGTPPSVRWDALDVQPRMLTTSRDLNAPFRIRASRFLDSLTTPWRPLETPVAQLPPYGDWYDDPKARAKVTRNLKPLRMGGVPVTEVVNVPYTGIAMNPPYGTDCERWILKAIQEARAGVVGTHRPKPYICALTRVNFWADGQRVRLLAPERLLWLEKRLSFTGDGRTDSSAHCWALWNVRPSGPQTPGETIVETVPLPPTSDEDSEIHGEMLGHARARQIGLFAGGPDDVPSNDREDIGEGVGL